MIDGNVEMRSQLALHTRHHCDRLFVIAGLMKIEYILTMVSSPDLKDL
jgi:hypothetical protein